MVCVGELILCLCTLCGYLFMKMGLCFLPVLLCGSFYARLCVLLSHCVRAKHVVCVCVCVCVCVRAGCRPATWRSLIAEADTKKYNWKFFGYDRLVRVKHSVLFPRLLVGLS